MKFQRNWKLFGGFGGVHNYVDYTGRWGIHEAFLDQTSATEANVTGFGTLDPWEIGEGFLIDQACQISLHFASVAEVLC